MVGRRCVFVRSIRIKSYQMSEMEIALRETQTQFYALDMKHISEDFKVDDGFNILKLRVKDAETDGSLQYITSTYSPEDHAIYDGLYEGGRKVISFCGVLQQNVFPLPELLQMAMTYGAEAMRRPVEIEFAVNLNMTERVNYISCRFVQSLILNRC